MRGPAKGAEVSVFDVIEGVLGILGWTLRIVFASLDLLETLDAVIDGVAWIVRRSRASTDRQPDA